MVSGILSAVSVMFLAAQASNPPLVNQDFRDGPGAWTGIGTNAKLTVVHDSGIALPGAGALRLDYTIAKGNFNAAYFPTALDSWTKAKSFRFRIHSDADTVFAVGLQEQDGGRYLSMVHVQKGAWQDVELSTTDFILSQDKNDPKDPDGKLDMDRVTGLGIADIAQFLNEDDNPVLKSLFGVQGGDHSLYIDSFVIGTDAIPASSASAGGLVALETFVHPQLDWLALGGSKLTRTAEKPLLGLGLRFDYHQSPGKPALLNRPLQQWILTGTKVLSFDIASDQPSHLIVQLEQYDGGKYNMMFDVPGGSMLMHKELLLSAFIRADDSAGTGTELHLAGVKSLAIIDATGMMDKTDHDNSLWIGRLAAQ